ncbi:MAG: 2',3'-cyclic-nucleotide 2'-phosphodiesterase/3'-nucleotidase/5'-nucleotidase, partial [Crocinitomicaceae bacterium]
MISQSSINFQFTTFGVGIQNERISTTRNNQRMKKILLIASLFGAFAVQSQCSDLFFSEYEEGSSSNKAFEIYNPTSSAIDLADYVVYRANNGSLTPTDSLFPVGMLLAGDVFVTTNPSAAIPNIIAESDTTHTMTFYNGDDAMWIKKISTGDTLDIIGEIGVDPGSGWVVGTGATNNFTLIRKIGIQQGQLNWAIGATEWDVYTIDMTDSLGFHTMTPCTACIPT